MAPAPKKTIKIIPQPTMPQLFYLWSKKKWGYFSSQKSASGAAYSDGYSSGYEGQEP